MASNPIKLDTHCPICKMKDNEILKLEKECLELRNRCIAMTERCIALLEEINGIPKPGSSKKPMLRVV
jgi:hypothetical protein